MIATKRFEGTLAAGRFLISAELTPPRDFRLARLLDHAKNLASYVDVVQLNDQLLAQARCSTLVCAMAVRDLGLEPVLQFSLRHRNRVAVQSDLLGIAAAGLRNVIVLGGYPLAIGTDPEALDATDLRGIDAIRQVALFGRTGRLFNGDVLAEPPDLFVGTIEIPCLNEADIDKSLDALEARIEAGARFVQVQAIFDLAPMQRWMRAVHERKLHEKAAFIAAVFPFSGSERLKFLQKVPGLCIPEHVVARVAGEDGARASLEITLELVAGIREMAGLSGLHLRCIGAEDWVPRILDGAGLRPAKG